MRLESSLLRRHERRDDRAPRRVCALRRALVVVAAATSVASPAVGGDVVAWGRDTIERNWQPPVHIVSATRIWSSGSISCVERSSGELVVRSGVFQPATNPPQGLGTPLDLAFGFDHGLALVSSGTVRAWGSNSSGQCNVPGGLAGVSAIAACVDYSLALTTGGLVVGWGSNATGCVSIPSNVIGAIAISAGNRHAGAILSAGVIRCWGANDFGQLNVPSGLAGVSALACGSNFTCAVATGGAVVGWGHPSRPSIPAGLAQVQQIAIGGEINQFGNSAHVVARRSDGTVVAWGANTFGQCNVPTSLSPVVKVAAGNGFSMALQASGKIAVWGGSGRGYEWNMTRYVESPIVDISASQAGHCLGRLANGGVVGWGPVEGVDDVGQIEPPADLGPVTQVCAALGRFSLALTASGQVRAWGYPNGGSSIQPPLGLNGVTAISGGSAHCLALRTNGSVVAWGWNSFGQCNVPTALGLFTGVAAGSIHSAAVRSNGAVACWGSNFVGESSPPSGLTAVSQVVASEDFTCALKSDGIPVVWGSNDNGQRDVPPNLGVIVQLAAGRDYVLALRSDGTLAAWGNNNMNDSATDIPVAAARRVAAGATYNGEIRGVSFALLPDDCLGDLNSDGTVNGQDLGFVLGAWGAGAMSLADLNRDGVVNGLDLGVLLGSWGACP